MTHEGLKNAIQSVWDSSCVIYREHYSNGTTHIQIFNPFWEPILDDWFVTGNTNKQADTINKVMETWNDH